MNKPHNKCPYCGSIIDERQIALFSGMVYTLKGVYEWCLEKGKNEFQRKEIKHLINTDNNIARFGDWILFGGLVYRPVGRGKGWYGLNRTRISDFFAGKYEIPTVVWKNPITKQIRAEQYGTIDQIPQLRTFLDENQEFVSTYREPVQGALI